MAHCAHIPPATGMDDVPYPPRSRPHWASFWLQPDGVLREVRYAGHDRTARLHLLAEASVPIARDNDDWYDAAGALESAGWVHISICRSTAGIYTDRRMRQAQIDTLYDILYAAPDERAANSLISAVREYVNDFALGYKYDPA